MMKSSNSESNQSLIIPTKLQRSLSPSGRFYSSSISSLSSPVNRITVSRNNFSLSPSVRYNSPSTSSTKTDSNSSSNSNGMKKKTCMCAPTTHPGSFRCRFHKNVSNIEKSKPSSSSSSSGSGSGSGGNAVLYHRLYARRSAMTNSLVRIGTVEGDLMKRALAALIRPTSNQAKRRDEFKPKASRLSVMSKAEDELVME